jgi:hypothetical protein
MDDTDIQAAVGEFLQRLLRSQHGHLHVDARMPLFQRFQRMRQQLRDDPC